MQNQHTIETPVEIVGIGLHTGQETRLRLLPAAPDTGVVFSRVDLPDAPKIPARTDAIDEQPRRTALKRGEAEVHTCEHLLSAARALGVDNLLVELNAAELPGCDGSARDFVRALQNAGMVEQEARREAFVLDRPVSVLAGDRSIIALPHAEGLRVTYVYDPADGAFGGPNLCDFQLSTYAFIREIAPARTFVTLVEAKLARAAGLGLGATYNNTLIWDDGEVLNNRLHFPDEPARHKVLDVIGDLALCVRPLQAHIIAQRTGHCENLALLRKIEASGTPHN